jgi:peptidyl-prolyl cis-trans isomerase A (cyclophilin A)
LEELEGRLLLDGTAPVLVTQFASLYFLPNQSVAIGLEASDADIGSVPGESLTYSVTSQTPGVTGEIVSKTDRFAALYFVSSDGTGIGTIIVQLFEDRAPTATDRFITLAENGFDSGGNIDPSAVPFYTDVVVHRVIAGFMLQTGDAENGDGTGGSPLGTLPDAFDPLLTFDAPGVLALANTGAADTSDCQFFITAAATPWLNGGYFVFGQMVSPGTDPGTGQSTYDTIINAETDPSNDRPINPPVLQSVEVLTDASLQGRYGTLLIQTDGSFTGEAQLTLTVTDQQGNQASQLIHVIVPDTSETIIATSGVETSFYMNLSGVADPVLGSTYDPAEYSLDPATWLVTVKAPAGYSGAFALTLSDGTSQVSRKIILSQNPGDPQLWGLLPNLTAVVMTSVLDGNRLYAGLSDGGLNIYDISNPQQAVLLGSLAYTQWDGSEFSEAFNSIVDMKLSGSTLFVLDSDLNTSGRLVSVDVSDPSAPLPLGSVQTADVPYSLSLSGNRAFVADLSVGLTSYDISDPAHLKKYNHAFTTLPNGLKVYNAIGVAVRGQYAYFSAMLTDAANNQYNALVVVDVSNPANMTFAGVVGTYLPLGLDIEGDRLFLTEWVSTGTPVSRLSVYDLSRPTAPKYLASMLVSGNAWRVDVIDDKAAVIPRNGTSITLLDVSDPLHMHVSYLFTNDSLASGETAIGYKPTVSSSTAAISLSGIGTMLFDVATLTDPIWVDSRTTFLDDNGTPVTVGITGGGSVKITTSGHKSGHILDVELFSAGLTTNVTMTTRSGKVTTADEIAIYGSAGGFTARTTNLAGNMTVEGVLKTLVLADVTGGRTIDLHTDDTVSLDSAPAVSITLGTVSDVRIDTHGLVVKSLAASGWLDGDADATNDMLIAPRVDRLTVRGDFAAGLVLDGTAGTVALGNARIGGTLGAAPWDITGDVGRLTAGLAAGSELNVTGVIGSLSLAGAAGVAIDAARIDRLTAKGDFGAELTLQGEGTRASLGSARIGGGANGVWDIFGGTGAIAIRGLADGLRICTTGSIAALRLGAARDSNFLAGFNPSVFTDPHAGGSVDFVPSLLSSIGSIRITGLAVPGGSPVPRFVDNSNFSAARMGSVQLRNVELSNTGLYALGGGDVSGIASVGIADSDPLLKTDPAHNWSWRPTAATTPDIIHLL